MSVDPITLATVWHGFQSLCREMRGMVTRTSQSYLMATLKDLSVGVWLADGSTVAVPETAGRPVLGSTVWSSPSRRMFLKMVSVNLRGLSVWSSRDDAD